MKASSKNLGRGNVTTKPKKNTVASLLAKTRGDGLSSSHPELTIEPIYSDQNFDQSSGGRRLSTYVDSEGKLQIKTVSQSPEIRNLSERESEEGPGSDTDSDLHTATSDDGRNHMSH